MNPLSTIFTIILSTIGGALMSYSYFNPSEINLNLSNATNELKSTQKELDKCQQTLTGMLMNKN